MVEWVGTSYIQYNALNIVMNIKFNGNYVLLYSLLEWNRKMQTMHFHIEMALFFSSVNENKYGTWTRDWMWVRLCGRRHESTTNMNNQQFRMTYINTGNDHNQNRNRTNKILIAVTIYAQSLSLHTARTQMSPNICVCVSLFFFRRNVEGKINN